MSEPTTQAGKRMAEEWFPDYGPVDDWYAAILAIEAEAREAEHYRLSHMGGKSTTPEKQAASMRKYNPEIVAVIEAEAALNQHLDECEGRCMCGAREHRGECHFGWHKDGCPDAPAVVMDDYMAGYRQARADLAARIEERVRGTFAIRAVMDVTFDDLMVSQAAVLAAIREEEER